MLHGKGARRTGINLNPLLDYLLDRRPARRWLVHALRESNCELGLLARTDARSLGECGISRTRVHAFEQGVGRGWIAPHREKARAQTVT